MRWRCGSFRAGASFRVRGKEGPSHVRPAQPALATAAAITLFHTSREGMKDDATNYRRDAQPTALARPLPAFADLLGAALALFLAGGALAVHDTGAFELDGNAVTTAVGRDDWDQVCHQVTGDRDCSTTTTRRGATAVSVVRRMPNPNATIFTGGGSKDPQDISSWAVEGRGRRPAGQGQPAAQLRGPLLAAGSDGTDGTLCPRARLRPATCCSSAPTASTTAVTPSRASGSSRTRSRSATSRAAAASASTACTSSATC